MIFTPRPSLLIILFELGCKNTPTPSLEKNPKDLLITKNMTAYLSAPDFDFDSLQMATDYDQNSSWSPYFGELIFRHVPLRENLCVLDVACGTGYPCIELSQRLGNTSHVFGIDTWAAALERAQQKIDNFGVSNVTLQKQDASKMDFPDGKFDLIVCNVGINNFESSQSVFQECYRVSKPGGIVAMTTNPVGHMQEFYTLFRESLEEIGLDECTSTLEKHIEDRKPLEPICVELKQSGFFLRRVINESFTWRFLNGTSFLNTFHIKFGFLPGWKEIVPVDKREALFSDLESRINRFSDTVGEFVVTVPMHYIEVEKPNN